jgi:hypothetical protein
MRGGSRSDGALVGAWRSSVEFRTGSFASIEGFEFLYAFHSGGTMTESSNYDAAPPVPPAYGVWRQVGPRRFEAHYEFFTTRAATPEEAEMAGGGWLPEGRGVLDETIDLAEDGDSFTSNVRYELFDTADDPVEGGGTGEGHGKRIGFRGEAESVVLDSGRLREFATKYTAAWCSQDAASVAAFFAEDGSLKINDGAPSVGRMAITEAAQGFMTAFPDLVVTMDGVDSQGKQAVYRWTLTGTNTGPGGTGRAVHISGREEWTMDADGLIAKSEGHFDEADYQRQLDS